MSSFEGNTRVFFLILFFSWLKKKIQVALRLDFVMTTHPVAAASTAAASHLHRWLSVRNAVSVDVQGLRHGEGGTPGFKKETLLK